MPIYEFYCERCHKIYNFFSGSVNTEARPDCPKCGAKGLSRLMSTFASPRRGEEDDAGLPDLDESKLEGALGALASEADRLDENNPRHAAQLMRKFSEVTGMNLGPHFEEALHRLEKGEDPEAVEAEMGDLLDDIPFTAEGGAKGKTKRRPPEVDDQLYFL